MTTGRQMCEKIAKMIKSRDGKDIDPKNIWNYSPTGELAMIPFLYEEAKEYFNEETSKWYKDTKSLVEGSANHDEE